MPYDLDYTVRQIEGFLDPNETALLHRMASEVPENGCIVEIGSYQGRSTIAMALGVKPGVEVVAIDPHIPLDGDVVDYSMVSQAALLHNLTRFKVGHIVRVISLFSHEVAVIWDKPVDFLFVDGSHAYEDARRDFECWSHFITDGGAVGFHDSNGKFPGIARLLDEILAEGQWYKVELVDATSIIKRVK